MDGRLKAFEALAFLLGGGAHKGALGRSLLHNDFSVRFKNSSLLSATLTTY